MSPPGAWIDSEHSQVLFTNEQPKKAKNKVNSAEYRASDQSDDGAYSCVERVFD